MLTEGDSQWAIPGDSVPNSKTTQALLQKRLQSTYSALSRRTAKALCPPLGKLDPIISEFATCEKAAAYDTLFRAKEEASMTSTTPRVPHDEVMAMARAVMDQHRNK